MWFLAMVIGCAQFGSVDRVELGDDDYDSARADVLGESSVCFTLIEADGRDVAAAVGMDSGTLVELTKIDHVPIQQVDSMARIGTDAFVCSKRQLTRIDLLTGDVEVSDRDCDAVTDLDGDLVIRDYVDVVRLGPWERVHAESGTPMFVATMADRLGRLGGTLIGAWHSTDMLQLYDPESGAGDELFLEGFDTWVWGVSGSGRRLFVLNDGRDPLVAWNPRIAEFDPNGRSVDDWRLGRGVVPHGLACAADVEPF